MLPLLIITKLLLSAVFGVAGVTKLLDRRGTREAVLNFGVSAGLVGLVSILLPLSELVVATSLLTSLARWGAVAALALLSFFIAFIGFNLLRGRTPECHCFGQLYSRPLGWPTLLRNIVFAVLGAFVLWRQSRSAALLDTFTSRPAQLAVGLAILGLVAGGTVAMTLLKQRRVRAPAAPTAGLPPGFVAPGFALAAYPAGSVSLTKLLAPGNPVILIFASPSCGPCVALFRDVGAWQKTYSTQITIAVISKGSVKDNFVNTVRNDLRNVLLQKEREVAELYQAKVTPTAIMIRTDGKVGSGLAAGKNEIQELIEKAVASGISGTAADAPFEGRLAAARVPGV